MSLALLFPAALAALAALLLPLLIHLARREQQRPTIFAALRWLGEQPRPRRRVRFDEWLLLLLRLLLLALLVLWLAQPVRLGPFGPQRWHVVMPGVAGDGLQSARQGAGDTGAWHWLADGFPVFGPAAAPPAPATTASASSLLRQLDAELPAHVALTVYAPEILHGADAERPRLSRDVDWQVVPAAEAAMQQRAAADTAMPTLWLHEDRTQRDRDDVRYLQAAADAWRAGAEAQDAQAQASQQQTSQPQAPVQAPAWTRLEQGAALPDDARLLAWLSDAPPTDAVRAWVAQGGVLLLTAAAPFAMPEAAAVSWRDADGAPLLRQTGLGAGTVLQWQRPLQAAAMPQLLEPAFAARLRAALRPTPAPQRVMASAHAPVRGLPAWPLRGQDLRPWLLGALLVLLLLERWWATSRRRSVAP